MTQIEFTRDAQAFLDDRDYDDEREFVIRKGARGVQIDGDAQHAWVRMTRFNNPSMVVRVERSAIVSVER
jgi:hypothetical protein